MSDIQKLTLLGANTTNYDGVYNPDILEKFANKLGLNYKDYITQNKKFLRPEELPYLKGDPTRIRKLGWKPKHTIDSLVKDMMSADVKRYD